MAAAVSAALVLATRLPFLASTLDDIDGVNFALALADFDPALHQPHPPATRSTSCSRRPSLSSPGSRRSHNGDRWRLALRVERFEISAR